MRRLTGIFVFLVVSIGLAHADHMTGRYQGTAEVAGVFLDLQQRGTALQGTISGTDQGTLQGQTDGGDNAQGVMVLGQTQIQFQAAWSPQALRMRLQFPDGPFDVVFVPAGSGQPPQGTPSQPPNGPGPQQPPPTQSNVQYFVGVNGQQVGPMTLDQILGEIQQGKVGPKDLVWKTGAPGWAPADSYPELAGAFQGQGGPPPLPPQDGPPPLPPGGDNNPPSGGGGGAGGGLTPPSDGGGGTGGGGSGGGSGSGSGGGSGGSGGGGGSGQTPSAD